jgi:hypothetical protein
VTDLVFFLIDTGSNDVSVYPSPASLTGDLEVDDVDGGPAVTGDDRARLRGTRIGRLLVPLAVRGQARNEMPANLRRLKEERLEARV